MTGRKLFGIGIGTGLVGVSVVVGAGALTGLGHQLPGQLAIIAASVRYAGAAVFGRNFTDLDLMLPAAGSMLCGAVILVPSAWLSTIRGRWRRQLSTLDGQCFGKVSAAVADLDRRGLGEFGRVYSRS
ncbi:hypothetical protein ACFQ1S_19850 [Kibdelosporangium lantanae]|uniref:Uncharacterized protein n=1 Tax=Kibdelosporangium lantanae TaxID=1497396 RepID=A0ABW3MD68_9PSEU